MEALIILIIAIAGLAIAFSLGYTQGRENAYEEGMDDAIRVYQEYYEEAYHGLHE